MKLVPQPKPYPYARRITFGALMTLLNLCLIGFGVVHFIQAHAVTIHAATSVQANSAALNANRMRTICYGVLTLPESQLTAEEKKWIRICKGGPK